ncbi:MAG: branched-chain amino acid transporter AzlD [Clostridiales bacterium]|nr:branched-chain amino acid transporter AzlD [Clostridiales bacterium]
MNNTYALMMILVIAGVTILLRFLPFMIFGEKRKTPDYVMWLGSVLPYAIMGMLVVYCLKGVSISSTPYGIPELISCILVIGLTVWKRNTLLSIGLGTICYMILVQFVF